MHVYLQFDIFERRPSVAALSDDSSDAASPSGSRAASRPSSRAASASPRATAALAGQAAAVVSSVAEPLRSAAATALQDPTLVLPGPQSGVTKQSATVRSGSDVAVSAAPDTAVSQGSAQVQTSIPAAKPAMQQKAAAGPVVSRQSPVKGAPLRGATGDSPTVRLVNNLAGVVLRSSPAAAAANSNETTPVGPDAGQGSVHTPQPIRTGASAPDPTAGEPEGLPVRIDSATFSAMAGLAPPISVEEYARSLAESGRAEQL